MKEFFTLSRILAVMAAAAAGYLLYGPLGRLKKHAGELRDALDNLNLLQEVGKEISSKLEMSELLPCIMNAFVRAGNVSKGSIMLYNPDKDLLEIRASVGVSRRAQKQVKLKIGEGIAGQVAGTGKPILINDTLRNEIYKDFFENSGPVRPRETILSLPLIFKGSILGVVTLDAKTSGEQFMKNDERLLSILASQAAVAINNAAMYEMAITDGLTKVFIRRYFNIRLEEEIEKARRYDRPLSMLFLDIDRFKEFNDTYGHQLGDQALIHLCRILSKRTRAADFCARYGGEEFVILLPETPKDQAMVLAERIRQYVEQGVFTARGNEYKINVSIGVASFSRNMVSGQDLVKEADSRLFKAKEDGRNRVAG